MQDLIGMLACRWFGKHDFMVQTDLRTCPHCGLRQRHLPWVEWVDITEEEYHRIIKATAAASAAAGEPPLEMP